MPLLRIGYGLLVVGAIAVAAIFASVLAGTLIRDNAIAVMGSIFGFAAMTITGVIATLNKLEEIELKLHGLHQNQEDIIQAQEEQHKMMNSRLDELVEVNKKLAHAAGLAEGIAQEGKKEAGP